VRMSIFVDNTDGIDSDRNFDEFFNASGNYWGHESGPQYSGLNGKGDYLTPRAHLENWYADPGLTDLRTPDSPDGVDDGPPETPPGTTTNTGGNAQRLWFYGLLAVLVSLFAVLAAVVAKWQPDRISPDLRDVDDAGDKIKEGDPEEGSYDPVQACPGCGMRFSIESRKRPLRTECIYCHESILLE